MTYITTHPWLKFSLSLERARPKLWILLGEAASKCEHIAGVPLQPDTARKIHQLYLAKGAAATTAIEGNSLTEDEVLQRIEGRLTLPPSREYLGKEVDNIISACNKIAAGVLSEKSAIQMDCARIKSFNQQVLEGLELSPGVIPGEIRTFSVGIGNVYRGAPAEDCVALLQKLCVWLNGSDFAVPTEKDSVGSEIIYAFIKAIVAHIYLAWIHPFGDGNGRTARLMEFAILLAAGIPQPACHLLSNHYNHTRARYYQQLDYASKSGGDILPFIEYAVQGLVDGLREQLLVILGQQWTVSWINYIHEIFRDRKGIADRRQRDLGLDLFAKNGPVPIPKLIELTPRIAAAYTPKSSRTLMRDLEALEKLGLIDRSSKGIRAKREIIMAFLPGRKRGAK